MITLDKFHTCLGSRGLVGCKANQVTSDCPGGVYHVGGGATRGHRTEKKKC